MTKVIEKSSARERIITTASDLFYRQGYRATGINEVIEKSGVAKATFYVHFPSKDDLCLACLQELDAVEYEGIESFVATKRAPRERFLAVMGSIEPWLVENNLRGCGFLNMVSEVPEASSPLRKAGDRHYQRVHQLIVSLAGELIASDNERYGELKPKVLADEYMVIFAGSVALAEIHHDLWPVKQAVKAVKRLID